jgi:hypothetical protein
LNVARALLFQAHLPKNFWSYAVLHAVFFINRIPTAVLKDKSPYEVLYTELPNLESLKVFGSLAYVTTLQANRTKLSHRGRKCIFLGYKQHVKGVILYDLNSKEILVSRHVTHHDHILPYHSSNHVPWHYHTDYTPTHHSDHIPNFNDHDNTPTHHSDHVHNLNEPNHDKANTEPANPVLHTPVGDSSSIFSDNNTSTLPDTPNAANEPIETSNETNSPQNTNLSRPIRTKHAPSYLTDYVCNTSADLSKLSSTGSKYPICDYHNFRNLSPSYHAYTLSVTHNTEPSSYLEACSSEHWRQAMNLELDALTKTGTWKIVDLPPNVNPIGSKWVYKVKYKADGSIERYKARLVAKGYNQVEGLDYFDTFSPVAKLSTVRVLLALASVNKWHLHQMDVNNAFLHGELQEDVYMAIPEGVQVDKQNQVCKLLKSLYGLKQASRKWYEKLTSLLLSEGYTQSAADYSLFTLRKDNQFIALLVYVDDIILAGTDLIEFSRIKAILDSKFKIKDLGVLKYFLGLEVAHSEQGIAISQRKYCLDLLKDSGLLGSKPAITPLDPSIKLHQDDGKTYEDV